MFFDLKVDLKAKGEVNQCSYVIIIQTIVDFDFFLIKNEMAWIRKWNYKKFIKITVKSSTNF